MEKGFLYLIIFILLFVFASYTLAQSQPLYLSQTLASASQSFDSKATYFEVYDKSPAAAAAAGWPVLDRLIIVQPFGWLILANDGAVYVVTEPEMSLVNKCSPNHTLAMRFEHKHQRAVCLEISFTKLLAQYTYNVSPVIVSFTALSPSEFTALHALKLLAQQRLVWLPNVGKEQD